MINRHPLQSQGAGQAERRLPDEAVVAYCDQLVHRLHLLNAVLEEEQKQGRISMAASQATHTFVRELRATVMVLALKHGRQLLDVEPVPLTIDPTESGMPTFKDFWMLYDDCVHAKEHLEQIPDRKQLLEQATETIFSGERPIKQQMLWLQRAYLERLAATPVVPDFRISDPVSIGKDRSERLYSISWTGVIHSVNLFECCTLHFAERGGWHVTGGVEALRQLIDTIGGGRHTLQEMIGLCNEAPWITPRLIERVTIGPYYHRWTENDMYIQRALDAATGVDPWMLRCTIESAATTRAAQRTLKDTLFGRQPMEAGPSIRSPLLVVPLSIKQFLGDADEEGQPCTVYGVTNDGDLVC